MLDKQFPTVHSNGLNRDRLFQDKNDVTFALNSIRDNHEGGRTEYQSEPGNQISATLPAGYIIVGSIYGQNEEVYIFSTNNTSSEIGIFKSDTYTTLVNAECLNFNLDHPISGEYRVRNGCERVIYWVDGFNPDREYNIDDPDSYKTSGQFDCNKFKLVPVILPIKTDLISVNDSGGILPLGSYYFQPEILDANENVIYSGELTPQVIIYDESQNQSYPKIDGGLNIEQFDPAIGGVPLTNKSITLRFYNLNPGFRYLRVNVIRAVNGTQVLDGHSVGSLIQIQSDSIQWTYQGYNTSAGDFPIDVSEKLVNNVTYQSSLVSEQVQGRYLRANLRQSSIDYSTYQSFASKITAIWVADEVEANNALALGNPKNPQTYWLKRGFQGDECYLPGIQYIHTNGIVSPVLPLIGRSALPDDLDILTVVPNNAVLGTNEVWLSDVEHLGLDINDTVERWKVFNTAHLLSVQLTTHPYSYTGRFSYYETEETYPDIRDCDGNLLWGEDADGNPITTDTKVRLFKFPDRRLVSHIGDNGEWTVPLGIKFDNIIYPNSDVIGHRFVFADRTEFDKTVVDSGWAVTPVTDNDDIIRLGLEDPYKHFYYAPGTIGNHNIRFNSAKTLFNQSISNFTYYKTNRVHKFESGLIGTNAPFDYFKVDVDGGGKLYSIISYLTQTNNSSGVQRTNHFESQTLLIDPGTTIPAQGFLPEIRSQDYYTGDTVSYINFGLEDTNPLLGNQKVDTIRNGRRTEFIVHNFYTYKKIELQPYANFLTRFFKTINHNYTESLNADDNIYYGGDTLIGETASFRLSPFYYNGSSGDNYAYTSLHKNHFEEHEINSPLRHGGAELASRYFKIGNTDQYNLDKLTSGSSPYELKEIVDIIPEYYAYNPDFTLKLFEKSKVPIPVQFNYCSGCSGYYPNRIVFSPKSFDEEVFDLYRINKVNDYIDMPAHRGQITGLSYQNNQLLVHMEDSTFIIQPNPQQISTDQNTAYLTTGDFLSIPPQELMQTDIGMGGLQSKQSACNTPFGRCWFDQKRGEIFKWDGKIEVLSNSGLVQWFKEYGPSELNKEYYKVLGEEFPNKSTLSLNGVGAILYYDPRFKRLLLSKKDYLPLSLKPTFEGFDAPIDVVYDPVLGWRTLVDGDPQAVSASDPEFFQRKSWTLSYNFLDQAWCSWHSYLPFYGFSDSNNFYTTVYSSQIWRHLHVGNYQKFYNTKYDFIIEWMNMDLTTSNVSNIYYFGYSQIWDDVNKQFKTVDTTFDKLLVYNFEQSSGLQTLALQTNNPYQNNSISNTVKTVIRTDQNYKIAGLYDMSVGQPTMTKDWTQSQLYNGYIDAVPNSNVINFNKSVYDAGNIWDKFVFTRLFYKPAEDHKKSVILQVLNSQQSVR